MTRQPTTRPVCANGAAGAEPRPNPALAGRSQHARTQAAWLEALCRIAQLHAGLADEVRALVENLEVRLAAGAEQSVMLPVPPLAIETPPKSDLLTTQELCDLLQCHERTLRRLELLKEIPAPVRKGRLKRWRRSDVDAWLAEGGLRR